MGPFEFSNEVKIPKEKLIIKKNNFSMKKWYNKKNCLNKLKKKQNHVKRISNNLLFF